MFPRLFFTNGREGTAVEYPGSLEDELDFSPELIALWARRTWLYQEIKYMKDTIVSLNESVEESSTQKAELAMKYINKLKNELRTVKTKHDEITEAIAKRKVEVTEHWRKYQENAAAEQSKAGEDAGSKDDSVVDL